MGLSVLLQGCGQGMKGDGTQQSLVPTLLFELKPCSVTSMCSLPTRKRTKPDVLKMGFVWSVVWVLVFFASTYVVKLILH